MSRSLLEQLYREHRIRQGKEPSPVPTRERTPRPRPNRGDGHRFGERHPKALLDEDRVRSARRRYRAGESAPDIASDMGVSRSTLYKVLKGLSWSHVDDPLGAVVMRNNAGQAGNRRHAILDWDAVRAIRLEAGPGPWPKGSVRRLAEKHGIGRSSMSMLLHGHTWEEDKPCG